VYAKLPTSLDISEAMAYFSLKHKREEAARREAEQQAANRD